MSHGASLSTAKWKAEESGGNRRVPERDFGGVVEAPELHKLPRNVLNRVTFAGALNECLRNDGREDQEIAHAIHVSGGYLSKLLRGVWSAQAKRLVAFMQTTHCIAPLQWMAREMGCDVVVRDAQAARIEALEAELAAARRAA